MVGINASVVFTAGQLVTALLYLNGKLTDDVAITSMECKGIAVAVSYGVLFISTLVNLLPGKQLHKIGQFFVAMNVVFWVLLLVLPIALTASHGHPIIPQATLWKTFINNASGKKRRGFTRLQLLTRLHF